MSPTPIRDPNAPPDPTELREIPSWQSLGDGGIGASHNEVLPGAPPSEEFPTGVPPVSTEAPAGPPVNVDVPHAMGPDGSATAIVGDAVTVTMGNWENTPDTYGYQWSRDEDGDITPISGATSSSYVTAVEDDGCAVLCSVLATNVVGQASIDSNEVAVSVPTKGKKK